VKGIEMAISPTYGTGTYNSRIPAISIPKIGTIGGVASPLDFYPSNRQSNQGNLISSVQKDASLLDTIRPSTAIRGGKKLYDMAAAGATSDFATSLSLNTAVSGLDVGTAMSGLDVGTSISGSGSDIFGLADVYGWGDAGSSIASAAGDTSSFFLADVGGFDVPWLAGVDNLFAGDITGAAEDTIGATVGFALGGPVGGFIGSTIAGDVFEAASDLVEDIGDFLGCYITTATCKLYNKPDDCYELTIMRKFRDEFVKEKYPEAVANYYATAPILVRIINNKFTANIIWMYIYTNYIVKAVEFAAQNKYEEAYVIYSDMVNTVKQLCNMRSVI